MYAGCRQCGRGRVGVVRPVMRPGSPGRHPPGAAEEGSSACIGGSWTAPADQELADLDQDVQATRTPGRVPRAALRAAARDSPIVVCDLISCLLRSERSCELVRAVLDRC